MSRVPGIARPVSGPRLQAAEAVVMVVANTLRNAGAPEPQLLKLVPGSDAWPLLAARIREARTVTISPDPGAPLHLDRLRPLVAPGLSAEQFVWALGRAVADVAALARERLLHG